jgi:integrase
MTKKPKVRENILNEQERKQFLGACASAEEILVAYGLMFTGLRVSEFIHLNKSWIDPSFRFFKVPGEMPCSCQDCKKENWKTIKKTGQRIMSKPSGVWKPKTENAIRIVPILPEVKDIFQEYFKKYNSVRDLIPNRIECWTIVKIIAAKSGIDHDVFPHVLRAVFAVSLADRGFTMDKIMQALGWSDLKTVGVYIRSSPERLLKEFEDKW